jgi:muramoyltetrapeptide carboxypeptidase LdcA involved in peptidoglycan recycling
MGSCLPSLLQLAGTKYFPDFTEKILPLETPEGESPNKLVPVELLRSLLADLTNLGVCEKWRSVVLERCFGYEGEELRSFEEMIVDFCETGGEGREFPVLSRVDVGHTDPMVTVPLNALARLDSRENF